MTVCIDVWFGIVWCRLCRVSWLLAMRYWELCFESRWLPNLWCCMIHNCVYLCVLSFLFKLFSRAYLDSIVLSELLLIFFLFHCKSNSMSNLCEMDNKLLEWGTFFWECEDVLIMYCTIWAGTVKCTLCAAGYFTKNSGGCPYLMSKSRLLLSSVESSCVNYSRFTPDINFKSTHKIGVLHCM